MSSNVKANVNVPQYRIAASVIIGEQYLYRLSRTHSRTNFLDVNFSFPRLMQRLAGQFIGKRTVVAS